MTEANNPDPIEAGQQMAEEAGDAGINPKDIIGSTKVPLHLVPPVGMVHQAVAHLDGALKYGAFNWRQYPVQASVYVSAMMRHIMALVSGEVYAEDSKAHHLGHLMAGANIILDAEAHGNLVNDLPEPNTEAWHEVIAWGNTVVDHLLKQAAEREAAKSVQASCESEDSKKETDETDVVWQAEGDPKNTARLTEESGQHRMDVV